MCGKIGPPGIGDLLDPVEPDSRRQRIFDEANAEYYSTVDWALDIGRGEFVELDLRSVPAHLVRRDPETEVCGHPPTG